MIERIPAHVVVNLDSSGSMRAFRNAWRHMPITTRSRFEATIRQMLKEDPVPFQIVDIAHVNTAATSQPVGT